MSLSLHLLERELVSLPPPKMTSKSYMTQYHYARVAFYIFGISVGFHHILFFFFITFFFDVQTVPCSASGSPCRLVPMSLEKAQDGRQLAIILAHFQPQA